MKTGLTLLSGVLLSSTAVAHHSQSYFSDEIVELEGVISDLQWRNPHIEFSLQTITDTGSEKSWRMETSSIYVLKRRGIGREEFENNVRVRVAGQASLRRDDEFLVNNVLLPGGREIVMRLNGEPHWAGDRLGGSDQWQVDELRVSETAEEDRGIFRVWSIPHWEDRTTHLPFTEAAIAGRADWDPVENFIMRCEKPGMPRPMFNPHPFEFVDEGEKYILIGEEFDIVRTIHMGDAEDPQTQPASPLGYSVGRWEGLTLVVETTRIDWPYFDGDGTPQSPAVETIERFTLSGNQSRLDYHMTITDPATFTEPATLDTYWLALDEQIEPYQCEVY